MAEDDQFAIDGIMGFSVAPLRFILGLGFVISLLSIAMGIVAIVIKLTGGLPPGGQGWASLTVLITFLAGMQLIVLGMIGVVRGPSLRAGQAPSPVSDRQRRGPRRRARQVRFAKTAYWAPRGSHPSRASIPRSNRDSRVKNSM